MGGIDFSKLGAGMGGMAGMDAMADEGGDDEGSVCDTSQNQITGRYKRKGHNTDKI